ncbi:MAG: hypothetical protein R2912_03605 [Eubacteriales bacterium]
MPQSRINTPGYRLGKHHEKYRYLFYRNRELAGETAVLHAFSHYGRMPYDCRVAIIGNGMTLPWRAPHAELPSATLMYTRKPRTAFSARTWSTTT